MRQREKRIEDYLHLYIGCDAQICINIEGNPVIEKLTPQHLIDVIEGYEGIMPILRPFTSLTEEDKWHIISELEMPLPMIIDDIEWVMPESPSSDRSAPAMLYSVIPTLLKMGIDLFELIPNSIALDSTSNPK